VSTVGEVGQQPALQLVFALRASLDTRQPSLDRFLNSLVVAQLEVEVLELLAGCTAPVAAKQTVAAVQHGTQGRQE
jgi:hypothetical protein